jgi:hypothetical protein
VAESERAGAMETSDGLLADCWVLWGGSYDASRALVSTNTTSSSLLHLHSLTTLIKIIFSFMRCGTYLRINIISNLCSKAQITFLSTTDYFRPS